MDTVFDEQGGVFARQISTPDLGDHSYVVVVGDEAAVIDPQRDVERFDAALSDAGARLVAVLETHIHNDYLTGGHTLASSHGASYYLPAESEASFEHEALSDGDQVPVGGWRLQAIATPGHTPNHTSYSLLSPAGEAVAVFSGGSMLVGTVGRSDLLGPELAEGLTRQQYRSVHRLADELPGAASVQPTHGAGSFCAIIPGGDETTSTIERERRQNSALTAVDEESFVRAQLDGATLFPAYYAQMAPANRAGPGAIPDAPLPRLDPAELAALDGETWLIDVRDAHRFGAGHIAGSLNVPDGDSVSAYVGWVVPWGVPIVLITGDEDELAHARVALGRIGIDSLTGAVTDGLAAWSAEGRPLARNRVVDFAALEAERPAIVIDVRDPMEVAAVALPGTRNVHVSELVEQAGSIPDGEVWVLCASGLRAAVAASLLQRQGRTVVAVVDDLDRHLGR